MCTIHRCPSCIAIVCRHVFDVNGLANLWIILKWWVDSSAAKSAFSLNYDGCGYSSILVTCPCFLVIFVYCMLLAPFGSFCKANFWEPPGLQELPPTFIPRFYGVYRLDPAPILCTRIARVTSNNKQQCIGRTSHPLRPAFSSKLKTLWVSAANGTGFFSSREVVMKSRPKSHSSAIQEIVHIETQKTLDCSVFPQEEIRIFKPSFVRARLLENNAHSWFASFPSQASYRNVRCKPNCSDQTARSLSCLGAANSTRWVVSKVLVRNPCTSVDLVQNRGRQSWNSLSQQSINGVYIQLLITVLLKKVSNVEWSKILQCRRNLEQNRICFQIHCSFLRLGSTSPLSACWDAPASAQSWLPVGLQRRQIQRIMQRCERNRFWLSRILCTPVSFHSPWVAQIRW